MAMWCSRCVNHSSSQSRLQQPCRETHMKSKKKLWHVVIQDMVSWESPSPCDSCVCTCTLASVLPHMFVSHRRLLSQSSQLQWLSVLFRCATSLSLLIPDCSNRARHVPHMVKVYRLYIGFDHAAASQMELAIATDAALFPCKERVLRSDGD